MGALATEDASGALAALEAELQKAIEAREAGEALGRAARAWLRLTESLFLEVLAWKGTGGASALAGSAAAGAGPPHVLPRLLSQLQHAAVARDTHAALAAAVGALRAGDASCGLPATLRRHITGDAHASAWEILVAGLPPVSIVLRGTETHVEGVRTDEPLDLGAAGARAWAVPMCRASNATSDIHAHRALCVCVQACKRRRGGLPFGWRTRCASTSWRRCTVARSASA